VVGGVIIYLIPKPSPILQLVTSKIATKTKTAAWFVSNCRTPSNRENYVARMQTYVDVNIYGDCGQMKCPRGDNETSCNEMLQRDYWFDYLTHDLFIFIRIDIILTQCF
jgi:hypothetical protein